MTSDPTPSAPASPSAADKTRERVLARSQQREGGAAPGEAKSGGGILHELRGWSDALFFAFVLAMFIRTYVFELFMIPTGSMTPTLIGDEGRFISEFDWDGDGDEDVVYNPTHPQSSTISHLQVHLREADGSFGRTLLLAAPNLETQAMFTRFRGLRSKADKNPGAGRKDMILVNKFAFWFSEPDRGDIIVFKVPDRPPLNPFSPSKPVYIKRCSILPGESFVLEPLRPYTEHPIGHPDRVTPDKFGGVELVVNAAPMIVDGKPVTDWPFETVGHFPWTGSVADAPDLAPLERTVSDSGVMMFGDNQFSSLDSRAWGEVPLSHLRGKAVLRYWPVRAFGFLRNGD